MAAFETLWLTLLAISNVF
jgi:predicted permease